MIRHTIRWVSYHINHNNKKARVFHGNCRMPFDVEFALMYGIKTKTRFKVIDLSYRKNLAEWMCILNSLYPPDYESSGNDFTLQPHLNSSSNNVKRLLHPNPAPLLSLGGDKAFAGSRGGFYILNKTRVINTKIISINNLKNSQNPVPFTKQNFACTS
jgi:hypothetical protein